MYKKIGFGICLLMMLALCACTKISFEGSRMKNETEYLLTYTMFRGEDTHEMFLNEGDNLNVFIKQEKGSVKLTIGMPDEETAYRGEIHADCEFGVGIPQSGVYEIKVVAERAAGSISVTKEAK